MRINFWLIVWLMGIPFIAFYVSYPRFTSFGRLIDTSYNNSLKIHKGMSMSEAQLIIGGPPGNYGVKARFEFAGGWSGSGGYFDKPLCSKWRSPKGEIFIAHGRECAKKVPGEIDRYRVEDSGRVESISWSQVSEDEVEPFVHIEHLIACCAIPLLLYAGALLSRRFKRNQELLRGDA